MEMTTRRQIVAICKRGKGLTRWEYGFILSLLKHDRDDYTARQRLLVANLYQRRVSPS